jgi:dATP pyrophosphohydrolase
MAGDKQPCSVLVVVHTPDLSILLMERVAPRGFWQSVTGSLEPGEDWRDTALRELAEETGLPGEEAQLTDWQLANRYPIPPAFLARYPEGTSHNLERVFSYAVPSPFTPRLAPREHAQAGWLSWGEALARSSSWTNRDAIRLLARRHLAGA